MTERPPIPTRLQSRPTVGGLVRPWVNIDLADGGIDFRQTHGTRWRKAWTDRLCQVDGQAHRDLLIFLGGPNQIAEGGYFDEPPVHPECAMYVREACPMIAGRMSHYRATPSLTEGRRGKTCLTPGCGCGGYTASEQVLTGGGITIQAADHAPATGEPAHPWYAVYARGYSLAATPEGRLLGGVPTDVVRVRQISAPPAAEPNAGRPACCRCFAGPCESDESGDHCIERGCAYCLNGCPATDRPCCKEAPDHG